MERREEGRKAGRDGQQGRGEHTERGTYREGKV